MARLIQGIVVKHKLMKESLIVVNKSGGAGAEGFLDVKERQGRSAQDHHHAVEPVHDADGDRRALQLEGHDAGVDDGARPVRALGQRREAVQDAPASTSPPSRPRARTRSRWAAPARSRKTRSSPSASRRRPAPSSSTCRSRAAARSPCSWSATTSTRRSTTRSRPSPSGAPASCGRSACFDDTRMPYKAKVTDTQSWGDIPTCKESGVPTDYVMLRGIFMAPGVTPDQTRVLRRPAEEGARDAGLEGVHGEGRLQHDVDERRRVPRAGSRRPRRRTSS